MRLEKLPVQISYMATKSLVDFDSEEYETGVPEAAFGNCLSFSFAKSVTRSHGPQSNYYVGSIGHVGVALWKV